MLDHYANPIPFYPGNNNFMLAATLRNGLDPNGLTIEFWALIQTANDEFGYSYIPSQFCTIDQFPADLQEDFTRRGMGNYLCPNLTDFPFYANGFADEFSYIEIDVLK